MPKILPRHFDSLAQEAYLNLWRTYDRLRAFEDGLFQQFNLTAQQYNVLRILRARHPEAIPTLGLSARLVTHAPDTTRMIDRLADRSLVDRERPANDRRTVLIRLTKAGLRLLEQIDEPLRECHQRQLGHLTEAKLRKLVELTRLARKPHEDAESHWR